MKSIIKTGLFFLAVVIYTSCAPVLTVTSDYDHSVDFTKYKTFSFYQLKDNSNSVSQLNKNRIVAAIKAQMVTDGYTEVTSNPDVYVNATTVKSDQKSLTTNSDNYGYGGFYRPYGWGVGYGGYGGMGGMSTSTTTVTTTVTGSIIIDVINAAKNELLWTGTGNKEIDKPSSNPDQTIPAAIAKIMASFPPGVKKSN